MPTNVSPEYMRAEQAYHSAENTAQKLIALKKMLSTVPKHKGTEKLQKEIKEKIRKLKYLGEKEKQVKKSRQSLALKKEGAAQVVLIGLPNSGKSTLLSQLSGHEVIVADYPFTTKAPEVRMIPFGNINFQGIEIPAFYEGHAESPQGKQMLGIIRTTDVLVVVLNGKDAEREFAIIERELNTAKIKLAKEKSIREFVTSLPAILVFTRDMPQLKTPFPHFISTDRDRITTGIWYACKKVRVQTKTAGRIAEKPVILKEGATVRELAMHVHKDFIRTFKFAKVWGPSAKFPGQQVGIEHVVKDTDIVEIFVK